MSTPSRREDSLLRLIGYPEQIDKFLEKFFDDRDIYYSTREMGVRDDDVQTEVWIHDWDDDTSTLKVMGAFQ
jgi:hypothetical protein